MKEKNDFQKWVMVIVAKKIRTYNYPQNRVTDHRIGFTIQQLDRVIEGKLEPIIEALILENQKQMLEKN